MKKQAFNPYLPLDTYIPDGEPHVFGDRVYIYGSHDAKELFTKRSSVIITAVRDRIYMLLMWCRGVMGDIICIMTFRAAAAAAGFLL